MYQVWMSDEAGTDPVAEFDWFAEAEACIEEIREQYPESNYIIAERL